MGLNHLTYQFFVSGIQLDQKITRQPTFFGKRFLFFDGKLSQWGSFGGIRRENGICSKKKPFDGGFFKDGVSNSETRAPMFFIIFERFFLVLVFGGMGVLMNNPL